MCNPTGEYAEAHTMYTTYVTVSGNAQQYAVMKVFYDAQKNNIELPAVFRQVHGGTTVSPSQQQGKDSDRGKRVTAGYASLKSLVTAPSTTPQADSSAPRAAAKFSASAELIAQHQSKKAQSKSQTEKSKKLKFLMDKRNNNPYSLSADERKFLQDNGAG